VKVHNIENGSKVKCQELINCQTVCQESENSNVTTAWKSLLCFICFFSTVVSHGTHVLYDATTPGLQVTERQPLDSGGKCDLRGEGGHCAVQCSVAANELV